MKGRDLAIVAAVVLLGGVALADSLRGRGGEARETTTETTRTDRDGPEPRPDAPVEWPSGRLRGTLVFTDADDCRVRVIGLGGGRERPVGMVAGMCELWAAPVGQRIASRTAGAFAPTGEGPSWFEIVDLARTDRQLGEFKGLIGEVVWSPDAQRLAWCDHGGFGLELEVGDTRPRRLDRCPIAYDSAGRLVFAVDNHLLAEDGRVLLRERDPIVQAHWGTDESLLVVLAGGSVRRYGADGRMDSAAFFTDRDVVPSPSNCAVLYEEPGRIHLADLGCAGVRADSWIAYDAAWSPNGRWIAVADPDQIQFHDVVTGNEALVWPARAIELYWRGD